MQGYVLQLGPDPAFAVDLHCRAQGPGTSRNQIKAGRLAWTSGTHRL